MEYFNNKARAYIKNYVETSLEKVEVLSGETISYNYKCHLNAVHHAKSGKFNREKVSMVVELEHGQTWPIIHFVNKDVLDVTYIDNSYGWWSSTYDYYLVRDVLEEEFLDITMVMIRFRAELRSKLPWWLRLLSTVEN